LFDITKEIVTSYPDIRIRISSIEPNEFSQDFLALIKKGNVCAHLHIPLQSGSDKVLGMMKRGYRTSFYKQLINSILTECPDISIGTDVVVGFPGETDKDFDDTVKYLNDLPISYLHVFPFSKRPNTKASNFPNQISDLIKKKRVKKLLDLGEIKKKAYIAKYLYHNLDVIVEKRDQTNGYYRTISDNYLKILVKSDNLCPRKRLLVKVISISGSNLIARPSNNIST
jgi:threonylcarbamoyladenosine tRNA methylthiotransferase MtaB